MKNRLLIVVALSVFVAGGRTGFAQLEFLKGLFGGRAAPAQRAGVPFQGYQALSQAIAEAESGDLAKSLELAGQAFRDSAVPLESPENAGISQNVVQLSKAWEKKRAKPDDVVKVMLDIVLPPKSPGLVRPYVGQWMLHLDPNYMSQMVRPGTRLPIPDSAAAELIRWAVLAKKTNEVKKRLEVAAKAEQQSGSSQSDKGPNGRAAEDRVESDPKKSEKPKPAEKKAADTKTETKAIPRTEPAAAKSATDESAKVEAIIARVFSVQLAAASGDVDAANKLLRALADEAKSAPVSVLDYLCHAVTAALREPNAEAAGLTLLEAVLDRAESALPTEAAFRKNAPWLRVRAAAAHARAGRAAETKRLALAAVAKPLDFTQFGAEYATYLNYLFQSQAVAALIDAGLIADGLKLAEQLPEKNSIRYWWNDSAGNLPAKLGAQLRKLEPAERHDLLKSWALPSVEREAVRSLVEFVPVVRVANGRAADEHAPAIGVISDVYSTDWDLVLAAQEVGKLDDLIRELGAIKAQTPSVQSLQTLAMVVRDGSANQASSPNEASLAKNESTSAASLGVSTTTRLKSLLAATTAAVPEWSVQKKSPPPMDTYVIAVEAARHPEWRETAEAILFRLIEHSQRTQSARQRDHFRLAWLETLRLRSFDVLPNKEVDGRAAGPGEVATHWRKMLPKLWDSLGFESANERAMGALSPTWFTHEGYFAHATCGNQSNLTFSVPLAGTFDLTFEGSEGGWSEGRFGIGGASVQVYAHQEQANFEGTGHSGFELSPKLTNLVHRTPWNRYLMRVNGDSVKYFVNGQLLFEDKPGSAAPWFTLCGWQGFTPMYRNLRISGSPTIPREVVLLGDDRLRGWVATYFDESKPEALGGRKYISVKIKQNGQEFNTIVEDDGAMEGEPIQMGQSVGDWSFRDGELQSARRSEFFGGESPSLLTYQRPLRDGETVRFEYFQQPGVTASTLFGDVIYAIGDKTDEVARLESSKGVTDRAATARPGGVVGKASDTDDHAVREGSGHANRNPSHSLARRDCVAELKVGWNSVAMSLKVGRLTIELNGKELVSDNVEPTNSRRFGFFHNAATSSLRVRNVVLSGDWPKELDAATRKGLESPEPNDKLANSRFLTYAINESRLSDNAYEIAQQAVLLDTAERYKFLHRWVIPNESHDLLRISGAFTPTHPIPSKIADNPIDAAMLEARKAIDPRFVQTGGNFVCPAILLVLAAVELDRLEELRQQVEAFPPESSAEMARNRAAMLGIIALLANEPEQATLRIRECQGLLLQDKSAPMYSRWGDVALASLAVQHPVTRDAVIELLEFIMQHQLHAGNPGEPEFSRFVNLLHDQAVFLGHGGSPETFATQPKSAQWRAVTQPRARSRGAGFPLASFDTFTGEMALRGGHDYDAAYFQSPLRGNYEVSCRLSHFDWREIQLLGAGIANALKYTHNEVKVSHPRSAIRELPLDKPIEPRVNQWHDYKLVVKDGRFTSYVNGQKLYQDDLPAEHDPWLGIVGWAGQNSRAVRNLVISGKPTIPAEINLLGSPDLRGWMTDYFATEWGQQVFEWTLEADGVMQCPQQLDANPARDRRRIENIIRYHRPMLEDGEISYEFFYAPDVNLDAPPNQNLSYLGASAPKRTIHGKSLVHPALDRMVVLLEPDGVKRHWLTDGRWERTGLLADNAESTVATRSVSEGVRSKQPANENRTTADERRSELSPSLTQRVTLLKPDAWNTVKLATKGDTLTVQLNGETVFTHDIDPTNSRHFGLFHYANQSNVRVRNIRYRGDWPKTLPSVADQDLAAGPIKLAAIPDADIPDSMTWDFTKSTFNRADFRSVWDSKADKYITATDAGLRYSMPAGETKLQVAGVSPKVRLSGDFIVTMEYEGLKTVAAEENWGCGIGFNLMPEGSYQHGIEVRQGVKDHARVTNASTALFSASRPHYFHNEGIPEFPTAGRLRFIRRGPTLYSLTAPPSSDNFRLITQRPISEADIMRVAVNADASDKASGSEFTLKRLSIRAAKIMKGK